MSMAATESSMKMKKRTCGRRPDGGGELRREASNVSEYEEGYHGDERASVPFRWESQPGTPKHPFHHQTTLIPPLTPPPSYHSSTSIFVKSHHHNNIINSSSSNNKSNLLQSMLPKRTSRKARAPSSSPPPALSFSSSSYQSCQRSRSVPSTPVRRRPRKDKKDIINDEEVEDLYDAHASALCFRGCYSSMVNKLMLPDFL